MALWRRIETYFLDTEVNFVTLKICALPSLNFSKILNKTKFVIVLYREHDISQSTIWDLLRLVWGHCFEAFQKNEARMSRTRTAHRQMSRSKYKTITNFLLLRILEKLSERSAQTWASQNWLQCQESMFQFAFIMPFMLSSSIKVFLPSPLRYTSSLVIMVKITLCYSLKSV